MKLTIGSTSLVQARYWLWWISVVSQDSGPKLILLRWSDPFSPQRLMLSLPVRCMWIQVSPSLLDLHYFEFGEETLCYCQILSHLGSLSFKFPVTWLTINFESIKIWSLGTFSLLADQSPAIKASYLASLFVIEKFSLRHYLKIAPFGLFKTTLAPAFAPINEHFLGRGRVDLRWF